MAFDLFKPVKHPVMPTLMLCVPVSEEPSVSLIFLDKHVIIPGTYSDNIQPPTIIHVH